MPKFLANKFGMGMLNPLGNLFGGGGGGKSQQWYTRAVVLCKMIKFVPVPLFRVRP